MFSASRYLAPALTSSFRRRWHQGRLRSGRQLRSFGWPKLTDVSECEELLISVGRKAWRVFSSSKPATEIWRSLGRQKSCSQAYPFFGCPFSSSLRCQQSRPRWWPSALPTVQDDFNRIAELAHESRSRHHQVRHLLASSEGQCGTAPGVVRARLQMHWRYSAPRR